MILEPDVLLRHYEPRRAAEHEDNEISRAMRWPEERFLSLPLPEPRWAPLPDIGCQCVLLVHSRACRLQGSCDAWWTITLDRDCPAHGVAVFPAYWAAVPA
jgi:hypothetical protein